MAFYNEIKKLIFSNIQFMQMDKEKDSYYTCWQQVCHYPHIKIQKSQRIMNFPEISFFPIVLLFGAESIYIEINIFKNKIIEYGN